MSGGRNASGRLAQGLIALAKSFVLLLGVPITLERLWMLGPDPRRLVTGLSPLAVVSHLGFLAIGVLWAYCCACLFVDVGAAMRGGNTAAGTSWSSSWASAIA